jgi:putative peptidoglycan lipid II flippase
MQIAAAPFAARRAWRLFAPAVTVGALAFAARMIGAVKIIAMARWFGPGNDLDAYLIALLLPSFLADSVAGCYTPSVVPALVHARREGGREAERRLCAEVLGFGLVLLTAAALLLAAVAPWAIDVLGTSFAPAKRALVRMLMLFMLPWLPVSACLATWRAALNASGAFAVPAAAPVITPLAIVGAVAIGAGRWGIFAVAAGMLAGVAMEAIALALFVRAHGLPLKPAWHGWSPQMAAIARQYLPLTLGAMVSTACVVVDQAVAASLGTGSVSTLEFGNKLVAVTLAIGGGALGTAILPHLSERAAARDHAGVRRISGAYALMAVVSGTAVAAVLIAWAEPLVRAVFERGAFQTANTVAAAAVQRFAALQIPIALVLAVVARRAIAASANRVLAGTAALSLVLNIGLDIVFARLYGLPGIALATAAVQGVMLAVLWVMLDRHERHAFRGEMAATHIQ